MTRPLAALLLLALLVFGSSIGVRASDGASLISASPLKVFGVPVPPIMAWRTNTSGMYPQVYAPVLDLRQVNKVLRSAVLADQREWTPYARKEREYFRRQKGRSVYYDSHGIYRTRLDRRLLSASTVVVSFLLETHREAFEGQRGGGEWISATVLVSSGRRVTIEQLFSNPSRGLSAYGAAWKRQIHRQAGPYGGCLDLDPVRPSGKNFRDFALTPTGLAVGVSNYYCTTVEGTVPYRALRPYLSKLGLMLVDGVRRAV